MQTNLGININQRTWQWFGLEKKKTMQTLFALPITHVRIPIPFDLIAKKQDTWDFSETDHVIEAAIKHKKKIHLQIGLKTIGYPEVNIPTWLKDQFPYLTKPGVIIDKDEAVQAIALEYIERVAAHYFSLKEVASIHVENEAFSRHLQVADYRSLSTNFNEKEVLLVKKLDKLHRPLIQNIPVDTPTAIPYVLKHTDILGLNVYNQCNMSYTQHFLWPGIRTVFAVAKALNKPLWVTEYQAAAWINEKKEPVYLFKQNTCEQGLRKLQDLRPGVIFLWDIEQLLWRAKGDKKAMSIISSLAVGTSQ